MNGSNHIDNEGNDVAFVFVGGHGVWEVHINHQYECEYDAQDWPLAKLAQMYGVTL